MSEAFVHGLERRVFATGPAQDPLTPEVRSWLVAHEIGFQLPPGTPRKHEALAAARHLDDARFTGVYDRSDRNRYGADIPVGTYITYPHTINVGRLLAARLITGIGVRTEYQGLGIVRRVLTDDLVQAQREGVPIAALTATEGGLYARYGFGVASYQKSVEVDARTARFRAPERTPGTVRQIDRDTFERIAAPTFDRFHGATLGSIGRAQLTPRAMAGEFEFEQGDLNPNPNRRFAARVHPDSGEIDGYVVYAHGGWHAGPRTITAIDLVSETREGYLALWQYLLRQSLTDTVRFDHAPAQDVLPWALEDPRAYRIGSERDLLWLRILDAERTLTARSWLVDGDLTLRVEDALGLIDGVYRLTVRAGEAEVRRLDPAAAADVSLDASALASICLGGVTVHQLLGTGRVTARTAAASEALQRLFASHTTPYTNTVF